MASVTLQGVSKSFGSMAVVDAVDLSIDEGEFMVLVGPSGCGKSTTLRMIAGLEESTGGTIRIGGRDVTRLEPRERNIAMVFQNYALYPHKSVRENLAIGTRTRRSAGSAIPDAVLDRFPILREKLNKPGGSLSGGQQQQLALARALCGNPRLLLLDEPSEGIQPSVVEKIGDLLLTVGIAVVVVEQNTDLARQVAHRAMVIERGLVGTSLTREELMDDDRIVAAMSL